MPERGTIVQLGRLTRLIYTNAHTFGVSDVTSYKPAISCTSTEGSRSIDSILHSGDKRHAEFMTTADLVLHDAQYTAEEYPAKKNWGHSTFLYVVEVLAGEIYHSQWT